MVNSTGKIIQLFDGQSVDGNGTGKALPFRSETADIEISGTFGGGTVTIERLSQDGSTWIQVRDLSLVVVSITESQFIPVRFPYNATIRLVLTGSTSPALNAWITRVGNGM